MKYIAIAVAAAIIGTAAFPIAAQASGTAQRSLLPARTMLAVAFAGQSLESPLPAGGSADHVSGQLFQSTPAELRREIADVLRRAPGSRQIGPTTIQVAPGLTMELAASRPKTGVVPADLTEYCPSLDVCVFNNRNFNVGSLDGHQLNYTICGQEVNLGKIPFPGGGWWNDKVSSIINNQTDGTNSFFYDYSGGTNGTWVPIKTLTAPSHSSDLSLEFDGQGRSLNDRIDGVHVCGSPPYPWHPNYP